MKVGDLICYNAVGQKSHTLGIIVDTRIGVADRTLEDEVQVKVQWLKRGAYLPKDVDAYALHTNGFKDYDQYRAMRDGENPCLWHKPAGLEKVRR